MNVPTFLKFLRTTVLGLATLATGPLLHAADLFNGGFDTVTGSNANYWSSGTTPAGALSGTVRGGSQGGYGWDASYFGGSYPTNSTFASTINGPVRQDLSGSGNTFIEGATYTVTMAIFGSSTYATTSPVMWSLGLTGNGDVVAIDHWFSDEFSASTVGAGNGGTIPNDHITTIASGSTGLKTVTLTYVATAADAGKVIGIRLGGDAQSRYTLASGAPTPNDYYGMMDTVTFAVTGAPTITAFSGDSDIVTGSSINLSWDIADPGSLTTLTLDDGSGPVDVLPITNPTTGHGTSAVTPSQNTVYTLAANGSIVRTLTIYNGRINSFTSDTIIALGPDYQATLNWNIDPGNFSGITISDGIDTYDVTADTLSGSGSRTFTVPNGSTSFVLSLNSGSVTKTRRVLRAMPSNPAKFSINQPVIYQGDNPTLSWNNSGNATGSWVGIYRKTDMITDQYSVQWQYISGHGGATGSNTFTGLDPGDYYAVLFVDGGYIVEQGPIYFTISSDPVLPLTTRTFSCAENLCTVTWDSQPGLVYKLYSSSDLVNWSLVRDNIPSGGTTTSATEDLGALVAGVPAARFYRVTK
ncbi:MAG: hypothetical protein QM755_24230 [Luteolibacter sp.]